MRDVDTTYAAKIFVQQLHVSVDDLECDQLIILILDGTAEIQACVSSTRRKKICKASIFVTAVLRNALRLLSVYLVIKVSHKKKKEA